MTGGLRLSSPPQIEAERIIVKSRDGSGGAAAGQDGPQGAPAARNVTLLLTRPEPAARRFAAEAAEALGPFAEVIVSPLQRIVPCAPLPALPPGAALAFTSENGVAMAVAAGLADAERGVPRRAWCVGARTGDVARAAGFDAQVAGGCADALLRAILADPPRGPLVHLSGRHQRGDLAERLRAAGIDARRVEAYDQQPADLTAAACAALACPRPVLAPLFSPRSATLLAERLPPPPHAPMLLAFLSPSVAAAWTGPAPAAARTAATPDADALCAALRALLAPRPADDDRRRGA